MPKIETSLSTLPSNCTATRPAHAAADSSDSPAFAQELNKAKRQAPAQGTPAAQPVSAKPAVANKSTAKPKKQTAAPAKSAATQTTAKTATTPSKPAVDETAGEEEALPDATGGQGNSGQKDQPSGKNSKQARQDAPQTVDVSAVATAIVTPQAVQPVKAPSQATSATTSPRTISAASPSADSAGGRSAAQAVPIKAAPAHQHDQHPTEETGNSASRPAEQSTPQPVPATPQLSAEQTSAVAQAEAIQPAAPAPAAPTAPAAQFASDNYPQIVSGVHGQLLPNGGTMQLRLTPPELGEMQLSVQMRNGVMSASFQTTTDQATRLLSHGMSDLKHSLETAGVSVERIQISQAPKGSSSSGGNNSEQDSQRQPGDAQSQRDQQRRQLLQRMWKKVTGGDPLDLVA